MILKSFAASAMTASAAAGGRAAPSAAARLCLYVSVHRDGTNKAILLFLKRKFSVHAMIIAPSAEPQTVSSDDGQIDCCASAQVSA